MAANSTQSDDADSSFNLLSSPPVIILLSSASAVLFMAVCSLVLCHWCMAVYVFRLMAPPRPQSPQPQADTPIAPSSDDSICYICVETCADTVLLACGHRGLCAACAIRLWRTDRRCPLCRGGLSGLVFLPRNQGGDNGESGGEGQQELLTVAV